MKKILVAMVVFTAGCAGQTAKFNDFDLGASAGRGFNQDLVNQNTSYSVNTRLHFLVVPK